MHPSSRRSSVSYAEEEAVASAGQSAVLRSGTLYKRGYYTWNQRFVALHADGMLTVAHAGQPAKHVISVRGGLVAAEQHGKKGAFGWRLIHCQWSGQAEPDLGLELASESFRDAQKWLRSLRDAGAICSEDLQQNYALPPRFIRYLTPPRELTRSASRVLHGVSPGRYNRRRQGGDDVEPDDALHLACDNVGRCGEQLMADSVSCCVQPRGHLTSPAGLRAIVRLIDALSIGCISANVLSLHNHADELLLIAAMLLSAAAVVSAFASRAEARAETLRDSPQLPHPPTATLAVRRLCSNCCASCVSDGSHVFGLLVALLLHVSAEAHANWLLLELLANVVGLAVQVAVVVSLGTAMALGSATDTELQAEAQSIANDPRVQALAREHHLASQRGAAGRSATDLV